MSAENDLQVSLLQHDGVGDEEMTSTNAYTPPRNEQEMTQQNLSGMADDLGDLGGSPTGDDIRLNHEPVTTTNTGGQDPVSVGKNNGETTLIPIPSGSPAKTRLRKAVSVIRASRSFSMLASKAASPVGSPLDGVEGKSLSRQNSERSTSPASGASPTSGGTYPRLTEEGGNPEGMRLLLSKEDLEENTFWIKTGESREGSGGGGGGGDRPSSFFQWIGDASKKEKLEDVGGYRSLKHLYINLEQILIEIANLDETNQQYVQHLSEVIGLECEKTQLKLQQIPYVRLVDQLLVTMPLMKTLIETDLAVPVDLEKQQHHHDGRFWHELRGIYADRETGKKRVEEVQKDFQDAKYRLSDRYLQQELIPFIEGHKLGKGTGGTVASLQIHLKSVKDFYRAVTTKMATNQNPPVPTLLHATACYRLGAFIEEKLIPLLESGDGVKAASEATKAKLLADMRDAKDLLYQNARILEEVAPLMRPQEKGKSCTIVHVIKIRSLLHQLQNFLDGKMVRINKHLASKEGSKTKLLIPEFVNLIAPNENTKDLINNCIQLGETFMNSVNRILDNPSLATVIDESVNVFILVFQARALVAKSRGEGDQEGDGQDVLQAAKAARMIILNILSEMEAGTEVGVPLFLNIFKQICALNSKSGKAKKKAVKSRTSKVVVEAEPVQSQSTGELTAKDAAAEAADAAVDGGLMTAADMRKIQMLLDLADGKYEVLPEVIASTGITIPLEKQQKLVQIIGLISSIKQIAEKKASGTLSAADTIDIIATQMFNEFDIEGQGRISLDVFCMALARMQLNLSPQEERLLFSKADKDGSGYITQTEFRDIIGEIQERFRQRLLVVLGLSKDHIYLLAGGVAVLLMFIFSFIIFGVLAFADGTDFGAAITGILPMVCGAMAKLGDPNKLLLLMQIIDEKVKAFFDLLAEK